MKIFIADNQLLNKIAKTNVNFLVDKMTNVIIFVSHNNNKGKYNTINQQYLISTKMKKFSVGEIDFSCTALTSESYPEGKISEDDVVEWYLANGKIAISSEVGNIIDWMEQNNKYAYDEDPLQVLDDQWEKLTLEYFLAKHIRKEVRNAA